MSISSDVLAGLTREQASAAALTGQVLVLAGAGTGKTKTLTAGVAHRIARRGIAPARILAVTFTNKAAAEMTGRIRATLGETAAPHWVGTFHGLGARQLRSEPEIAGLRPGFDIMDADDSRRVVKRVMQAMNLESDEPGAIGRDPLKLVCNRLSWLKDNLVLPDEAAAYIESRIAEANHTGHPVDAQQLRLCARIYIAYQRTLRDANAADFGDLLLWPARAMRGNPDYLARWAGRFDAVLVDEYQDINPAQYSWIRLLASQHRELFAVGDDDQSVYSWRGSDIGYIRRFARDFPGAAQVRLEENFRSTGHILAAANAVIARDPARLGKTLYTRRQAGDRIEILAFATAEAEARAIVSEIGRRHADGRRWSDMAILYRGNSMSRGFEEALMVARIPYVLVGDVGFYQRAEIKDALALLRRLAANPDSPQADEAFRRVINVPARGFGPRALKAVETEAAWRLVSLLQAVETAELPPKARSAGFAFADAIRAVARNRTATLADQISLLLDATGYRAMLRESRAETTEDRLDNLQELITLAGGFHTARELLDHAALATNGPQDETTDRVRLMTIHKCKGLEFPHVFLPAWEAGTFPTSYGDLAEERRLAYVALTRGMQRVTVSYAVWRRGSMVASPFLADIPPAHSVNGWLRGVGVNPMRANTHSPNARLQAETA